MASGVYTVEAGNHKEIVDTAIHSQTADSVFGYQLFGQAVTYLQVSQLGIRGVLHPETGSHAVFGVTHG